MKNKEKELPLAKVPSNYWLGHVPCCLNSAVSILYTAKTLVPFLDFLGALFPELCLMISSGYMKFCKILLLIPSQVHVG